MVGDRDGEPSAPYTVARKLSSLKAYFSFLAEHSVSCRISNMGISRFPERGPARTTVGLLMCGSFPMVTLTLSIPQKRKIKGMVAKKKESMR